MSSSTLAGTSSAIRISGASGRTGVVMPGAIRRSRPDGEPQPERPRPFLGVDVAGGARCALHEEVDLTTSSGERRPRAERERRLLHALLAREEREGAAARA